MFKIDTFIFEKNHDIIESWDPSIYVVSWDPSLGYWSGDLYLRIGYHLVFIAFVLIIIDILESHFYCCFIYLRMLRTVMNELSDVFASHFISFFAEYKEQTLNEIGFARTIWPYHSSEAFMQGPYL